MPQAWQMCGTIGDSASTAICSASWRTARAPSPLSWYWPDGVEQLHDGRDGGIEGAAPADVDRHLGQRLVRRATQLAPPRGQCRQLQVGGGTVPAT